MLGLIKYIHFFGAVILSIIWTIFWRILGRPKVPSWPIQMELFVEIVRASIHVLDSRKDFSWPNIRFLQDGSSWRLKRNEAIIKKVVCNGVAGEFITSTTIHEKPRSTVLYLHGGGYCVGSCFNYRSPIANMSRVTQSTFLVLEYGLAPEHRFPHALEETYQAYLWLLSRDGIEASNVVIGGDSAGGGLAISLMTLLLERGIPLPAGLVLISPWTNLTAESCIQNPRYWPSFIKFNPDNLAIRFAKAYIGDQDPKNPLISPYYADLSKLPPLIIFAGGGEEILADVDAFHRKCKEFNLKVTYEFGEDMPHVYPILYQGLAPQVDASLEKIRDFMWSVVQ